MAVADYVTKDELEDIRAEANRVIKAIQRGTSANF